MRIFALLTLAVAAVTVSMASDFTDSARAQSGPPAPTTVLQPAPGHPAERTGNVIVRFKSGASLAAVAARWHRRRRASLRAFPPAPARSSCSLRRPERR